ncbi:MAG: starvation-sensing protein RspA [Dehalococcoidia bacterium]|nr:starvation-sensing protein RspA [Dehalococcoidia bacterium]MSQ35404.1 starvation-sensing protein RspA [Dehalococcoidia bacterium]
MSNVKIRDIRVIFTEPDGIRLVIVKVETTEPGLYGVGCATFTQRPTPVKAAIEDYLKPFLLGKSVDDIEDIWQSSYVSSYWRNSGVLNNAMSGVDEALWDIKGKMAGMPVYDLLGGKAREAAPVYVHSSGSSPQEVGDKMEAFMEKGFHHIRVQVDTPGYSTYGSHSGKAKTAQAKSKKEQVSNGPIPITTWLRDYDPAKLYAHPGGVFEPKPYMRSALDLFEHIRGRFGYGVEILHDVHERIPPILGVWFAKEVEKYQLFFLEDLFSPEDNEYFRLVRQQCSTPISMGELWNSPHEVVPMIKDRLIDFIRIHISQMGGITPCRKIAAMGELFNVRTAWHGPGDTSPVGHAANLMLDLNCTNFGIQEAALFGDRTKEVFPGSPEVHDGCMWPNGKPGLGIDIDEKLAAKYPFRERAFGGAWDTVRRADGTVVKP